MLATVVRGRVPEHIRGEMTTTLEAISIDKREELAEYAGDPAAFADIEEDLCKLLQAQRKEPEEKKTPWKAIVIIVAIFIAIGVWAYQQHQQSLLRDDLISTLRQEPGLVVLDQNFSKRIFRITVLSDPHARKPSDVIATEYKYFDVSFEQYSHLSALDSIIAKRAQELLQPPATVELGVENNVLSLHGTTNDDWFKTFEQRWPAITGLKNINLDSLTILYPTREAIAVATKVIEGMELNFEKGQTGFQANDELIIAIAENINRLNALALKTSGKPIRIDVIGYTDASGSSRTNKWIGLQRANNLKAALVRQGVAAIMLKTYSSLTYPLQGELSERKTRLVVHFN